MSSVPVSDTRRRALSRLALPAALSLLPGLARAQPLRPTPAQTEGPFYPTELPADTDFDLLRQGTARYARGQAAWLEGQVRDTAGRPLAGALVEIWQCDADGHYRHPRDGGRADPAFQAFGRVATDAEGRYRFRTLRPVAYEGRTPHIHLKLKRGARTLLTTQLYVEGDPGNERDFLWRSLRDARDRAALTRPFEGADGGELRAQFPLVVALS
ncbi:protocatechuate 3,4-dioxygenase [Paucibacter sp. M5-1]|uniref:protocatechuate 3,4-dioxygenase n=1 Tax=Paucibacter sp. M5-1 TaxID=3015998 RepID=UPI0022B89B14|nr:protocatechuate 3,4-dioxygenase [Paucibacter sp. M5-1]MCZ7884079.1 protocatechuate 3,4-dioxygenase [Paucibacter sp. M5-1]